MILLKSWLVLIFAGCLQMAFLVRPVPSADRNDEKVLMTGYFEGNEPFWDMEIKDNQVILHCVNDTVKDTLLLSRKQTHTETYAFRGREIFGVLRRSTADGGCDLDITEEPNPTHDLYFSYKGVTYMGCGKLTLSGR